MKTIVKTKREIEDDFISYALIYSTIRKKNDMTDFAILDCAISKKGKYIVCLATKKNTFYNIYENAEDMDKKCHEFIALALNNCNVQKIICDCSITYLTSVMNTIYYHSKIQVFKRPRAEYIERIMCKLIRSN